MAKVDFLSLFESCKQSLLRVTRTGSALSVTSWVAFWTQWSCLGLLFYWSLRKSEDLGERGFKLFSKLAHS